MNETLTTEQIEALQKAKTMLDAWDILTLAPEEAASQLASHIKNLLLTISNKNDIAQEIYVVESVEPLVSALMQDLHLNDEETMSILGIKPDTYDSESKDAADVKERFHHYAKQIVVRASPLKDLSTPQAEDPFDQFIKFNTFQARKRDYLLSWANAMQFEQFYAANGVPFRPDVNQIENLFHTSALMNIMALQQVEAAQQQSESKKIDLATAGSLRF